LDNEKLLNQKNDNVKEHTDNRKITKSVNNKNTHSHDPISAFYKNCIRLKEGAKSSLEIIFKYFNMKYPDYTYDEFLDLFKRLANVTPEISIEGEYLCGGIYQNSNALISKDNISYAPPKKTKNDRSSNKTYSKIGNIPDEDVKKIQELYKTMTVAEIQKVHFSSIYN